MSIRNKSQKQSAKDREIAKIKKGLSPFCVICGGVGSDAAHLLPRSTYPEHYTNPLNIVIMCRCCHVLYDNDIEFRSLQTKLIKRVKSFDELAANRYFKL